MNCGFGVGAEKWFEFKSFISNGPGWEGDVAQKNTPYTSGNHFAQCGKINVFARGSSDAMIYGFNDVPPAVPGSFAAAGKADLTSTSMSTRSQMSVVSILGVALVSAIVSILFY